MLLTFHGAELLLSRKFFFVKYFLRHAIKHAEDMTVNSSFTAAQVAKLSKKPTRVVPFGCGVEARARTRDRDSNVKNVLFVGRLIAQRGGKPLAGDSPARG